MDGHGRVQRASFLNTFNHLFRRGQSSSADEQHSGSQLSGASVLHARLRSSEPIQLGHDVTTFPGSPSSHAADEDVEMLFPPAAPPGGAPYSTAHTAHVTPDSSQVPLLPHTGPPATSPPLIDSESPETSHPFIIDDDARSDTSMPPLYDASDSECEEDHVLLGGHDATSESDVDAYDVEMTLLRDDGDLSDYEDFELSNDSAPPLPSTPLAAIGSDRNPRRVVVEELEDRDQPRTDTAPSVNGGFPGPSPHIEMHTHWHANSHLHLHPHLPPHLPLQPPRQHPQNTHTPHSQQPDGDIRLPHFPPMPGLRAQSQVEGQVPLPGLRTLFQPLFVEAVAQAGERFRTAQGTGQGPAIGPGGPIVQVTFDVPVFRVPTDAQTREQPQAWSDVDAQRLSNQAFERHERAFAAPPLRPDRPTPPGFNLAPPTPNTVPTDAMPPALRQLLEAAFEPEPPNLPDGPQLGGGVPGWAGLMGLLFGLGLSASHELNREDPVRAKRLVKGLEAVNTGLVKRMRKISDGNANGATCAICWDALLEEDAEITPDLDPGVPLWGATADHGQSTNPDPDGTSSAGPEQEQEEPLPKVIALPCSHVFHSACLVPWFSRPKQTTCPTCRFDVDPENLTYEPVLRPQGDTRQQPQQGVPQSPPPAVVPQQMEQQGQESSSGAVPPFQQATLGEDGSSPLHPPPLRRTIFEHTFTIPFPPPPFPFPHPQVGALFPQPQPEGRQHGPGQQGPFPAPAVVMDPMPPLTIHRTIHTLRQLTPHAHHRPQQPQSGAPVQVGPVPAPPPQAPLLGQGLQPPPQDGQRNANGLPRFPGLFQFDLPQIVRMPDGTWFWSAPLGGFSSPPTATVPQASPRPVAPKRAWSPPPPPGLTLRQRVEQGEREKGLRCDDMSCGLGPSDDDPEPTADLARVVVHSLEDGASGCGHTFHPACLVSAERVAGWGPNSESERSRAGGLVEVSCPVCRAVGVVPRDDWEKGVMALA